MSRRAVADEALRRAQALPAVVRRRLRGPKPLTPPLPTFLIIGAQKSATRWLRMNLGQHPEVFAADRELRFFDGGHFDEGIEWYRRQFDGWWGEPAIGEATPGYMMWQPRRAVVPRRIKQNLPHVKLVAIVRNPVDRTYSAFIHHMREGSIDPGADLLETVRARAPRRDPRRLIAGGWYASSLEPFLERFGDNLLVCLYDDVKAAPELVYRRVCQHIGVRTRHLPKDLRRVRYSNPVPPSTGYSRDGSSQRRRLTMREREELWGFFEEDVERLEQLFGLSLSHWRPRPD